MTWDLSRTSGDGEKMLDSIFILKVKLIEFAHTLVMCKESGKSELEVKR